MISSKIIKKPRMSGKSLVQKRAEDNEKFPILSLPEVPLSKVCSFLNLIDLINLTMTCKTLHQSSDLVLRKRTFDLIESTICYSLQDIERFQHEKVLIKSNLPRIGHAIHDLSIYVEEIDEAVMEHCVNVASLRLYSSKSLKRKEKNKIIMAGRRNAWIEQLKLKSLWFGYMGVISVSVLSRGVINLKELRIDDDVIIASSLFERNPTIERLSICVDETFDFRIFRKLKQLKCLHIFMNDDNFDDIIKFVKLDDLTEFSLGSYFVNPHELNSFLECLAGKTSLEKLMIVLPNSFPDADTFRALKLFNLTALDLEFDDYFDDYTQFIQEIPSPQRLKYLKLRNCSKASLQMLVTQWKNVETICLHSYAYWEKAFLNGVLESTSDRQLLKLNIFNSPTSLCIEFWFKSQQIKIKNVAGCINKHVFEFQADDCNLY